MTKKQKLNSEKIKQFSFDETLFKGMSKEELQSWIVRLATGEETIDELQQIFLGN